MAKSEESPAVYVGPAKVRKSFCVTAALTSDWVILPTTARAAPAVMDIGELETVMIPPGATVWPASTRLAAVKAPQGSTPMVP